MREAAAKPVCTVLIPTFVIVPQTPASFRYYDELSSFPTCFPSNPQPAPCDL